MRIVNSRINVVCGYAFVGKLLIDYLGRENDANVVVCDNSRSKQGNNDGLDVMSVENAVRLYPQADYWIGTIYHVESIKQQLISLGINLSQIITELPDEVLDQIKEKFKEKKYTPRKDFKFEIDLTDHCNLNCKGCDVFSSVADAYCLDLDELEKDLKRVSELFSDGADVKTLYLLGGEPLLHPDINRAMRIARQNFPNAYIAIITNGLLLKGEPELFWNTCREYDIAITPTWYPINVDYDELGKIAKKYGVKYHLFGASAAGGRTLAHYPLDLTGSQSPTKSYLACWEGNECIVLRNHRFWTCSIAPHFPIFNKHFNKNIPLNMDDGIDIYKAKDQNEIRKFLAQPRSFCKYCNSAGRTQDHPWEKTEGKIEEWI